MNVVLDSNVIIAAFASTGLCHSLFELCVERFTIILSEFILGEVRDNLHRKLKMPSKNIEPVIEYLREFCTIVEYTKLTEPVSRDKDDDEILALARSNHVKYIVTGDKDLLSLKRYCNIKIAGPREFWIIAKKNS